MLAQVGRSSPRRRALRLQSGHAERLPFGDAGFDLVYSVDVVHHLRDLDAAFREVYRVLKPGGRSVTATDSEVTIRARVPLSSYFPTTISHELARYPSTARLLRCHARYGLEIVAAFVVEMPYVLRDVTPFRQRAFSCLHLISDDELRAGIQRLERDLPLACVSRNYVIVAEKEGADRG
jgi:ubiquinone/menaquinone biosynthesis C-methylase UbiE